MTNDSRLGLLRFQEEYFPRIWGGRRLQDIYGKRLPPDTAIGEAWLISDHSTAETRVAEGPYEGKTLQDVLRMDAKSILGTRARLTVHGRFPLLLKLLDANDILSVQVHPDDDTAARLGEPDTGKTEMWYVLEALPGAELYCGLKPRCARESLMEAVHNQTLDRLLHRFGVEEGDSVLVPAGMVHAIGPGLLLAEIQQNSDLTYRLYDWGRTQADGRPRELHLDKALTSIHYGAPPCGVAPGLALEESPVHRSILAACAYFAADKTVLDGASWVRETRCESFHILLGIEGAVGIGAGQDHTELRPGCAVMVTGGCPRYTVEGRGAWLTYYVPDVARDVVAPLLQRGHKHSDIDQVLSRQGKDHPAP